MAAKPPAALAAAGVTATPPKLSDEDRLLIRSGALGDFDNLVVYIDQPKDGQARWNLVNRSDVPDMPPGIAANFAMSDETRRHCFTTEVAGEVVEVYFFCRVESGKKS